MRKHEAMQDMYRVAALRQSHLRGQLLLPVQEQSMGQPSAGIRTIPGLTSHKEDEEEEEPTDA